MVRQSCTGCIVRNAAWDCDTCHRGHCEGCLHELCNRTNIVIERDQECVLHFPRKPCIGITVRCKDCNKKYRQKKKRNLAAKKIQNAWLRSRWEIV